MGRITETIRCMVRLTDSAILEVAIRCSSAFSRLTDALKAKIKRQTIEQPKRASGRSFASVVTRKRPSLNRALRGPGSKRGNKNPIDSPFLEHLFPPCCGWLNRRTLFHGGNRHGLPGYFVRLGHTM